MACTGNTSSRCSGEGGKQRKNIATERNRPSEGSQVAPAREQGANKNNQPQAPTPSPSALRLLPRPPRLLRPHPRARCARDPSPTGRRLRRKGRCPTWPTGPRPCLACGPPRRRGSGGLGRAPPPAPRDSCHAKRLKTKLVNSTVGNFLSSKETGSRCFRRAGASVLSARYESLHGGCVKRVLLYSNNTYSRR